MKTINIFEILVIEFNRFTGIEYKYTLEKQYTYNEALQKIEKLKAIYKSNEFTTYNFEII
jgi:hypothetical protein